MLLWYVTKRKKRDGYVNIICYYLFVDRSKQALEDLENNQVKRKKYKKRPKTAKFSRYLKKFTFSYFIIKTISKYNK